MPIVNIKNMLQKARDGKYAILHANVINYDMAKAVILAAEATRSPIIVAVSEKALHGFSGAADFANMVKVIVKDSKIQVPVAIHLDHGEYKTVLSAINNGFTSVMYDGSKMSLKENLKNTRAIVALAKKHNITVECEVGTVLGKVEDKGEQGQLASIEECKALASTGIDALAAGIGNLHGNYPKDWKGLNFQRLNEIHKALPRMPLVLHGGSGIPNNQIKKAISLGVCKFNVGTEFLTAFTNELVKYFNSGKYKSKHGYDPRNYFPLGLIKVQNVAKEKIKFLGSVGKASK